MQALFPLAVFAFVTSIAREQDNIVLMSSGLQPHRIHIIVGESK